MFDDFADYLKDIGPEPISRFFPRLMYRTGGSQITFATPGNTSFSPPNAIIQIGCTEWD